MDTAAKSGAILIVDDNAEVLQLVCQFLRAKGFAYFSANSPVHALEIWKQHADKIAMLISDLRMPGMYGDVLASKLVEEKPSLKVLIMTGTPMDYTVDARMPLIAKPFQFSEFLKLVTHIMSEPAPLNVENSGTTR